MSATGYPDLGNLEYQKKDNAAENAELSQRIYKNNSKETLKNMQIVRFGDVAIAIYRPSNAKGVPDGSFGSVYRAYPIFNNGHIDKSIALAIKIVKGSERSVMADGDQISNKSKRNDTHIIAETSNDNAVFSARTTRIPMKEKSPEGHTIYQTAILMSAAPGIDLQQFLADNNLRKTLTPERRLRLAINVIKAYRVLHAKGIYHGDIKPENILVDPKTLEVTIIDLDTRARTFETISPEDGNYLEENRKTPEATEKADIYSIAQGLLIPILSDESFCRGMEKIKRGYIFDNHPIRVREKAKLGKNLCLGSKSAELQEIIELLDGMRHTEPEKRWPLEIVQATLESLLQKKDSSYVIEKGLSQSQNEAHRQKLWSLDRVLADSKYEIISYSPVEIPAEPLWSINHPGQSIKASTNFNSFLFSRNTISQTHPLNRPHALSGLIV